MQVKLFNGQTVAANDLTDTEAHKLSIRFQKWAESQGMDNEQSFVYFFANDEDILRRHDYHLGFAPAFVELTCLKFKHLAEQYPVLDLTKNA